MTQKIDLVIPFVNGNDPIWRFEFNKYMKEYNPHYGDGNVQTRYDGNDILKYVFRSIAKHAPWINKIHLLLSGPSQIPEWLDKEKVHIVYHKDFIPEEFLPTFNSTTIEMFLANIDELSEKFIYSNDDIIITSQTNVKDFFRNGKPLIQLSQRQKKQKKNRNSKVSRFYYS